MVAPLATAQSQVVSVRTIDRHLSDGIGDLYEDIVGEIDGSVVVRARDAHALRRDPPARAVHALPQLPHGRRGSGVGGAVLSLVGAINRYVWPHQVRQSSPTGRAALQLHLPATLDGVGLTAVVSRETWPFQAWRRDAGLTGGSSFTSSVAVTFD